MPTNSRATDLAHEWIRARLPTGGIAIDATAGNGYDTAFLAQCVGSTGRVFAFDIQSSALNATREKLHVANLLTQVELIHAGHETMASHLAIWSGRIHAVMFNLGYLPGGDHTIITQPGTTQCAINQALALLHPEGIVTVMLYPHHPGGGEEADAILKQLALLDTQGWRIRRHDTPGPVLIGIDKK